ncbi:Alpha/Beta hydrolase protein [Cercophora newfieldiana]|uniref:Alpha/Beta hydrolase protein n=1 Tax=Cercophora newfieldiana TaxID=92897 RepID=A0AA39Y2I9_9PEZI|nr:Alpha/Beta hydrolase protein [Cercophora newfieldiana]
MPSPEWSNIKPASLAGHPVHSDNDDDRGTGFRSMSLWFDVPLDHRKPLSKTDTLTLHAKLVYARHDAPDGANETYLDDWIREWSRVNWKRILRRRPIMLYLCGGPGDGNNHRRIPELNRFALDQGYQVLYVDYRGTGRSRPFIDDSHLSAVGASAAEQAAYLALFRQDNIARDLEAIRLCLSRIISTETCVGKKVKWTVLGQSFGGWIALTYLSFLPASLAAVYLTAGLAPVSSTPHEVYARLYRRVAECNESYYQAFPSDAELVRRVVIHLRSHEYYYRVDGCKGRHKLTAQSFMTLGRCFGQALASQTAAPPPPVFERLHALIGAMVGDIGGGRGLLSDETGFRLHERPLYGVLHEAIYCHSPGVVSGWAAEQIGRAYGRGEFSWLERSGSGGEHESCGTGKLFFSGEMVYPSMFGTSGSAVGAFKGVADALAAKNDWPALYDEAQLAKNRVPVRALAYRDDMYVDFDLSLRTARKVRNCVVFEGKAGWGHGAIKDRTKTGEVLRLLFGLDSSGTPESTSTVRGSTVEDVDYPC